MASGCAEAAANEGVEAGSADSSGQDEGLGAQPAAAPSEIASARRDHRLRVAYFIPISSTSKTRSAPGGIAPSGVPWSP
jgi:hypothetical protein